MITVNIVPADLTAIAHVGNIVTHAGQQWTVHAVEGSRFYAHQASPRTIIVDYDMTACDIDTRAYLVPMGTKVGQGFGKEVPLAKVRRGVCLSKSYK